MSVCQCQAAAVMSEQVCVSHLVLGSTWHVAAFYCKNMYVSEPDVQVMQDLAWSFQKLTLVQVYLQGSRMRSVTTRGS